ncbi:hypothetical protein V6Z12_D02G198500 [Gossypium hirsutum]
MSHSIFTSVKQIDKHVKNNIIIKAKQMHANKKEEGAQREIIIRMGNEHLCRVLHQNKIAYYPPMYSRRLCPVVQNTTTNLQRFNYNSFEPSKSIPLFPWSYT